MKKLQRIKITTSKDFAELVQREVGKMLWLDHGINSRSEIITEFREDPEQVLEVRFISSDDVALKIEDTLKAAYEFSEGS